MEVISKEWSAYIWTLVPGALILPPLPCRSVSEEERALALGLQFVLFRLLAYIPAPIMFGSVIDSTCLMWTSSCGGGRCLMYDIEQFRFRYETLLRTLIYLLFSQWAVKIITVRYLFEMLKKLLANAFLQFFWLMWIYFSAKFNSFIFSCAIFAVYIHYFVFSLIQTSVFVPDLLLWYSITLVVNLFCIYDSPLVLF